MKRDAGHDASERGCPGRGPDPRRWLPADFRKPPIARPSTLLFLLLFLIVSFHAHLALAGFRDLQEFKRGDADVNGVVEFRDALRILAVLFGGSPDPIECGDAADADDDGEVNLCDAVAILYFVFYDERPLPPPFICGPDPTEDSLLCKDYGPCGRPPIAINAIGMELSYISPGSFLMGSPETELGRGYVMYDGTVIDETRHGVILTKGFYIGVAEVTIQQYVDVMGGPPGDECSHYTGPENPVVRVGWVDAESFCERLSAVEGQWYRLPTEAEWEYSCRAGTKTRFWFGDALECPEFNGAWQPPCESIGEYIWFGDDAKFAFHDIKTRRSNPWGLHDVHDGVGEYCSDWYAPYPKGVLVDPEGPSSGGLRVVRGFFVSGVVPLTFGRSAFRYFSNSPSGRGWTCTIGFRVVRQVFFDDD